MALAMATRSDGVKSLRTSFSAYSPFMMLVTSTILARIVDVTSIMNGEYAENEVRKDFTPSERVAIAKAIERKVGNRQGQRTDKQQLRGKIPEVDPGKRT